MSMFIVCDNENVKEVLQVLEDLGFKWMDGQLPTEFLFELGQGEGIKIWDDFSITYGPAYGMDRVTDFLDKPRNWLMTKVGDVNEGIDR